MNAVGVFFTLLLFLGLFRPISFLLYLLFIFPSFGSLAMLPPEITGGVSLTPGSLAALFFLIKAATTSRYLTEAIRAFKNTRQLGFLAMFWIVALIGAIALPRIFNGAIRVYTMKSQYLAPVSPTMANFTQASYLTMSVLIAAFIAGAIREPKFKRAVLNAILAGGFVLILTGLLDIVANAMGAGEVLSYFRTASYAFMIDNQMAGARRVIGLLPEASAYGGGAACFCSLILFLKPLYPSKKLQFRALCIGYGCGLMALLSLSSTAYVAMAVVTLIYTFYRVDRVTEDQKVIKKSIANKVLGLSAVMVILFLAVLLSHDLTSRVNDVLDSVIFQKRNSVSYVERTSWTTAAYNGFLASNGLGLGVGSVRTSNFFVNILASTGVIGGALFALFLFVVFTRKAEKSDAEANVFIFAAKLAIIPNFVGAALAGTTPDFGIIPGVLFGIIAGLGYTSQQKEWVSPLAGKNLTYTPSPVRRSP